MQLRGILPALVSPLDETGAFERRVFEQLMERVYTSGADGIYVCGSTGEGLRLPGSTRKQIAEAAIAGSPRDKQVIVHVGAATLEETIELGKHAAGTGATAISSLPLRGGTAETLPDFYRSLAAAVDVPVVAYYFPIFAGFDLTLEQLSEIAAIPGVKGIKFTDFDLFKLSQLIHRGTSVYNGRDEVLAAGLLMGASGGIGSIYNVLPGSFVRIFDLAQRGEWEEARKLQMRVNEVIAILIRYPLISALKRILTWRGLPCGEATAPSGRLTEDQADRLRSELEPFADMLDGAVKPAN